MDSIFKTPKILLTRLPTPVPAGEAEVGGCKPNDGDVVQEIPGEKPMEGVARSSVATEVDSDSTTPTSRCPRRRPPTAEGEDVLPPSENTSASDRRSASVTGSSARKHAKKAEEALEDRLKFVKSPVPPRVDTDEDQPVTKEDLEKCGHVVRAIVRKSGNLKGTSQKALNWVTNKITRYITQPESEVVARLECEVKKSREHSARLEASMKLIQEENTALRRRLEELEASASKTSAEEMWAMVEARVQARVESALMGPAQRPALAHETRTSTGDTQLPVSGGIVGGPPQPKTKREKGKGTGKKTVPVPPIPTPVAGPSSAPPQTVAGPSAATANEAASRTKRSPENRKKEATAPGKKAALNPKPPPKEKRKKPAPQAQPASEPRPLPPAPASMETPWVEVVGRNKKKRKPAAAVNTQPRQPARRAEPKLRECLGSEDVKVSRPTKTVELRLTELDYTATPESVAAALSKAVPAGGGGRQVQANDVDEVRESAAERPMEVAAEFTRPF
ncbi:proteoglycan 4-like [Manduca sexta]|uniref:proteoglycan 4-like n=1 Tax=Manduca sexta TaxID=7130 RepID=UPI00188E65DB|nr:proteoglycan 4-like [Manduca sexta]